MYETGGHFIKHRDWIGRDGDIYNNRIFSTITLINRSDDLEGGNLLIWDREDGNVTQIELDIGETVIFNSRRFHQVTPIIRGTREVLVAWIYLKK
jgi:predicted 2-oxoglutarate/Fe(II)-dependent dioxygenase YbiX